MFQCYSLKSSHPGLLPQSPKVCSLYLCLFCCLTCRVIVTIFLRVLGDVEAEWARCCERRYGVVESYRTEGAELLLVTSGTVTSTARFVVDRLRDGGEAFVLVKVKMFRPFPG